MRQTLITLLAIITLLSQWGWVEHDYHHHTSDDVCEVCISASGHVAVLPSTPSLPGFQGYDSIATATPPSLYSAIERFYNTRAPPHPLQII
jgi:hypothetical protein